MTKKERKELQLLLVILNQGNEYFDSGRILAGRQHIDVDKVKLTDILNQKTLVVAQT